MKRFNPTVIGAFVLGALLLGVVGIVSFGARTWWGDREYLIIYFDESVHGLERGSAVKLKGVRIGRVAGINITYEASGGIVAQVVCELDRSRIVDPEGVAVDIREPEVVRRMVEEGLQARLNLIGITGMLFVEMDFYGQPEETALLGTHPDYVVVPSVRSALSGLAESLAGVANQLGQVDFIGIGESISAFMNTANQALDEARLTELVAQLHETVRSVNEVMSSEELKHTLTVAGESFERISSLAERLEAQVDPLAENLTATTEDLRTTLEEVAQTFSAVYDLVGPRMGLGPQVADTLASLNEAARSVQRLADFLERNPQAILRGRGDTR
jgi:paraquat-inducible protein B